jgi:hypothetical protein
VIKKHSSAEWVFCAVSIAFHGLIIWLALDAGAKTIFAGKYHKIPRPTLGAPETLMLGSLFYPLWLGVGIRGLKLSFRKAFFLSVGIPWLLLLIFVVVTILQNLH